MKYIVKASILLVDPKYKAWIVMQEKTYNQSADAIRIRDLMLRLRKYDKVEIVD